MAQCFGSEQWYFYDSSALIDRSTETERHGIPPLLWPPQNPDLNPLENM